MAVEPLVARTRQTQFALLNFPDSGQLSTQLVSDHSAIRTKVHGELRRIDNVVFDDPCLNLLCRQASKHFLRHWRRVAKQRGRRGYNRKDTYRSIVHARTPS